jgi:hypothetical protein
LCFGFRGVPCGSTPSARIGARGGPAGLMVDDAAALLSRRCNVFVATDLRSTRNIPSWSGYEARNQTVGVHYWLQSALQAHPWRVTDARKADVVFVNASFAYVPHSLLHAGLPAVLREAFSCSATGASPHHCASAAGLPTHSHSCRPLRFATGECSQQECSPRNARLAQAAEDGSSVVWVKDFVHRTSGAYWNTSNELVAPFVVYQPWWLVSARGASAVPAGYTTPWDERKLVFFAGHVPAPNLYSSLRWHLWRQIVHEGAQRATVRAADLYIYWPFSRCVDRSYYDGDTNSSQSLLSGFLTGFCERFCTRFPSQFLIYDISGKPSCAAFLRSNRQSASEACERLYAVGSSPVRKWQSRLRDRCPAFARLNVSAELAAAGEEAVAPGRLGLEEYMREAMVSAAAASFDCLPATCCAATMAATRRSRNPFALSLARTRVR